MKNSYFAEKFLHTFALLTCSMVLCSTYSTAQVFRKYIPPTDESNRGSCIINMNNANDYLTVGDYILPNSHHSGHALWTDDDGVLLDQRNYNNGTDEFDDRFSIKMIAPEQVEGSYSTVFPHQPRYKGHPIVGTQTIYIGNPVTAINLTWVAILDPVNKNIVWSHVIDNISDDSRGIAVHVDVEDPNTFYVLSNMTDITNIMPNGTITLGTRTRFAVTKYSWTPGNVGHQLLWSKEYDENGNGMLLSSIGIVEESSGELVVVGNKQGAALRRIFKLHIDKGTGAILTPMMYLSDGADDARANSVSYSQGTDKLIIAGRTNEPGTMQPLLLTYDFVNGNVDYAYYYVTQDSLEGEFNYAKVDIHTTPNYPLRDNITAVGYVVNGEACIMNVFANNIIQINWTTNFNFDYGSGSATVSKATWFDKDNDNFMITGTHTLLSNGSTSILNGSVQKYDGAAYCVNQPIVDPVPSSYQTAEETIYSEDWWTTDPYSVANITPELSPYYCFDYETFYGKRGNEENIQMAMTGLPSFTARYADNAIHIQYSLSQQSPVEIIITDILGNTIAQETLYEQEGSHHLSYEAHHLSSGAYILSIRINDTRFTQHLSIIK
jgi:hypothetical protein